MRYIFLALVLLASSGKVSSQVQTTEIASITAAINDYFQGYIERDIDKLNKAFDIENGTMKVPVTVGDSITGYKNLYFKDLMPRWGSREKLPASVLENCKLKILNIDMADDQMATARISMKVDNMRYIDILSLQRIGGLWKITNKMYLSYEN